MGLTTTDLQIFHQTSPVIFRSILGEFILILIAKGWLKMIYPWRPQNIVKKVIVFVTSPDICRGSKICPSLTTSRSGQIHHLHVVPASIGFLVVTESERYNLSRLNLAMGLVLAINSYSEINLLYMTSIGS